MTILITGANGQLGSKVAEALLALRPDAPIAVSVRNPGDAAALRERGVDVRAGDFDDPASLAKAFAGVSRLLIVSTSGAEPDRLRQHANAVAAAERAGVGFIAYTSVTKADTSTLPVARVHLPTEQAIRATGIPFALLRNNWYLENELGSIAGAAAGAPLVTATGQARIGWALREDYAQAAAAVLAGGGHENQVYELGGAPATFDDLADALGAALGRPVAVQQVDDEGYGAALAAAGLPDFLVPLFVSFQGPIRDGALDAASPDLERLLGRPATPLREAVARVLGGLSAEAGR